MNRIVSHLASFVLGAALVFGGLFAGTLRTPDWHIVAEVATPAAPAGVTYVGASSDGSVIGFLYPDGKIRFWSWR
jgi:hypothetical protein